MTNKIKNITKNYSFDPKLLDKVGPWLSEMRIKYNSTRFGISTKVYKKWIKDRITPSFKELWGICELIDLMEFYNSFHSPNEDQRKIFHLIKSGSTTLEKSQKCSARDFSFELKVASRFKRAGFDIINDKSHDVVVTKGDVKLFIECKRPRNEKTLINLISYAYNNQLSDLTDKSEQGVICIDLSNIIYNDFMEYFKEKGAEDILSNQELLERYRNKTDLKFKNIIEAKTPEISQGINMVILSYTFPIFIESPDDSGVYHFSKFNHFARITTRSDENDQIISKAFMSSVGVQLECELQDD